MNVHDQNSVLIEYSFSISLSIGLQNICSIKGQKVIIGANLYIGIHRLAPLGQVYQQFFPSFHSQRLEHGVFCSFVEDDVEAAHEFWWDGTHIGCREDGQEDFFGAADADFAKDDEGAEDGLLQGDGAECDW